MRTIGRHLPKRHRGDPTVECAYCGLVDYMSKMRKDAEGKWACRLEGNGRTGKELNEANAAAASRRRPRGESGNADWGSDEI